MSVGRSGVWYAAVKYRVDDEPKDKIKALRDGLMFVACELVEEHGVSVDDVRRWLDDAGDEAEYADEERQRREEQS